MRGADAAERAEGEAAEDGIHGVGVEGRGAQPVIPDRSGANTARTRTITTNAVLRITDGFDRRAATTRLAGVTAGGRPVG
ncbi:hypothetical protein MAFF212519_10450 [Clavibacter michiganensis]